ncbi:hypothetical protein M501DRAFT_1004970 [Patellaria atrata CBS 101060]|uniref:Ribosome biogenesis protein Alb1 n=1 Tax=Patellaria atrata CBS 101060 TaxID=1346257 RepID=A0A9P4VS27_9PEZI|nr:hypothetical protein M501DRAFT_1004970 [Patellaria atrata CBS 101060]
MAKTAKPKNKNPSLHSRAARRASSPSLNTDKSLKNIPLPANTKQTFTLNKAHNASIPKRKKQKQLTRQQRLRREKGIERAEVIGERLEVKREKSGKREKRVKERSREWEVVNGKGGGAATIEFGELGTRGEEGEMEVEDEWEDEREEAEGDVDIVKDGENLVDEKKLVDRQENAENKEPLKEDEEDVIL